MSMPRNLILMRHGQSEGNVVSKMDKKGDQSAFTDEFKLRPSHTWRLTDMGIWQAQQASQWIHQEFNDLLPFDGHLVSWYHRAMETAYYLNLPDALWRPYYHLREQDWGMFDVMPNSQREEMLPLEWARRKQNRLYWTAPGGESMADLTVRLMTILGTLHREFAGKDVIIVCHGAVMWAFRVLLERMSEARYMELDNSKDPYDQIHNCQIIQYSRVSPETGDLNPYLRWCRSVCPWDMTKSSNNWQENIIKKLSNDELLAYVNNQKRMINNPAPTKNGE